MAQIQKNIALWLLTIMVLVMSITNVNAQYNKDYFLWMGRQRLINDEYREAITVLNSLIRSDERAYEGYFLRGIAKYNMNDLIGADSDLSLAIEYNPVYTTAYTYRAITRSRLGNYDDALKDFAKAIDLRPDLPDPYYSRGITRLLNQQFEEAIEDFDLYIRQDRKAADAYTNRGICYLQLKDTARAYENFDIAIRTNRNSPEGYNRRGSLLYQQNKLHKAEQDFNRAIQNDSTHTHSYFNRALTYNDLHRPNDALNDLDKVIELEPSNSLSYFNRAIILSQVGDYNKALEDFDQVAYFSPDNVLVYFYRANLLSRLGEIERAEEDYTRAIELYPDFANAYLNRSHVRYMLGDMVASKRDNDIAEKKISDFKHNMSDSSFSLYADTSKVLNRLLSFDNLSGKEFENVKAKDVDIKLLDMYRVAQPQPKGERRNAASVNGYSADIRPDHSYAITSASSLFPRSTLSGLEFTREPLNELNFSERGAKRDKNTLSGQYDNLMLSQESGTSVYDFDLGVLAHQMKQFTLAIKHFDNAIAASPSNPFLYMNRAVAGCEMIDFISSIDGNRRLVIENDPVNELKSGKRKYSYDSQLKDMDRAIAIKDNVAYFYYNRANIYCMMGSMPEAIADYGKAIELHPYFAEAYYNRGLIQLYLKDSRKGHMDMSRAGELGMEQAYTILRRFVNNLDYKD